MNDIDLREKFGSIVRRRRNEMGFSQEELAGRAGLHRTYVADIERGARNPSLESIQRLAQALDLSMSSLFAATSQTTSGSPATGFSGHIVNILLVEDDPADATLTLRAFERARLSNQVHVVRDGAEALAYVLGEGGKPPHQPDMILLDLKLPKVDGIEVLRRLKEDERARSIPVVVLTGSERDSDVAECRRLGAETYIVKPVDFHRLTQVTPQLNFGWALHKP